MSEEEEGSFRCDACCDYFEKDNFCDDHHTCRDCCLAGEEDHPECQYCKAVLFKQEDSCGKHDACNDCCILCNVPKRGRDNVQIVSETAEGFLLNHPLFLFPGASPGSPCYNGDDTYGPYSPKEIEAAGLADLLQDKHLESDEAATKRRKEWD